MNKENAIITIGNRSQTSPCCTINNTAFYYGSRCSDHNRSPFRFQQDRKLMDILLLINSSLQCTFARCSVTFCQMPFSFFLTWKFFVTNGVFQKRKNANLMDFPFQHFINTIYVCSLVIFCTFLRAFL